MSEICEQRMVLQAHFVVEPGRTLTDWLGMSNLTTSSVSERLIIYSTGVKRTKNLLLQANPVSFVIVWALE